MLLQILMWCLSAVVGSAAASYVTFDPVCTRPVGGPVSFVTSPDTRGTMEILWGSLFTLVACTWTIHHPNVPEQRDGRSKGLKGDLRWGLKSAWESAKLALVTVLAPELIISIAWDQCRIARKVKRELRELAAEDGVPWTLVHGHFAAMGGFIIRYNKSVKVEGEGGEEEEEESSSRSGSERRSRGVGEPYHLTADDVIFLRRSGHLKKLPHITRDELCDKSKSDPLLKLIAICQISWSIIQISTRAIRRLPISPLELNVLALAACAIVIYGLCWYKPKHVQVARTILTCPRDIPAKVKGRLEKVEMSAAWVILFDTAQELQVIRNTYPPQGAPLSNTRIQFSDEKSDEQEVSDEAQDNEERARDEEHSSDGEHHLREGNDGRGGEEQLDGKGNRGDDDEMISEELDGEEILSLGDEEEAGNERQGNERLGDEEMGGVRRGGNEGEATSIDRKDSNNTTTTNNNNEKLDSEKLGVAGSLFVATTLFGAVHVAGWNLSFPTRGEQIVWRGATVYILTLPCMLILLYLVGCFLGQVLRLKDKTLQSLLGLGGTLLCWVYLFARLFILVETVRTFVSLPPDVFIATWTVNIPHFA